MATPKETAPPDQRLSEETISELYAQQCAAEPIHRLGTVQPHGFLVVVDLATQVIVQVSTGVSRHWRGLGQAERLIGAPLADWIDPRQVPCAPWLNARPEPAARVDHGRLRASGGL
jgi:light-regulated signal transduction histidine kinase (bacteriophytochrome)